MISYESHTYLLQQRALDELNTFVRVLAEIPRDWPRAKASETPSILTANAKLLQIFAAYDITHCMYQSRATDLLRMTFSHMIQKLKSYNTYS